MYAIHTVNWNGRILNVKAIRVKRDRYRDDDEARTFRLFKCEDGHYVEDFFICPGCKDEVQLNQECDAGGVHPGLSLKCNCCGLKMVYLGEEILPDEYWEHLKEIQLN